MIKKFSLDRIPISLMSFVISCPLSCFILSNLNIEYSLFNIILGSFIGASIWIPVDVKTFLKL